MGVKSLLGRTILVTSMLAVTGCGLFEEEEERLPGKRYSVLLLESDLEPDPRLSDLEVRLPAPKKNAAWPQSGGFPDHAMHHLSLGGAIQEVWSSSIGDGGDDDKVNLSQPIVVGNTVFTLDVDFLVRAFNTETGKVVWESELAVPEEDDEAFGGGLSFYKGRLYVSTGFAKIFALSGSNGELQWEADVSAPVRGAPTVMDDRVLVVTIDNQTFAFDSASGDPVWSHAGFAESAGLVGGGHAAAVEGAFVIPYTSGEIYTLNSTNGRVRWSDNLSAIKRVNALASIADIRAKPVIDRGVVFAVSHSGRMVASDLRSGGRLWDRKIGGSETPWIAGDFIYLLANDGHLAALTRRGGRVRWLTSVPVWEDPEDQDDRINWVGPVLAGDRLILGNSLGELVSVSPYTGEILGQIDVGSAIRVSPVIADNMLYILTENGTLSAYR